MVFFHSFLSRMLMWEDGFCRGRIVGDCMDEIDSEDPVRKAFSKMSIQLYNYGEGWVLGRFLSNMIYSFLLHGFLSLIALFVQVNGQGCI